LTPGSGSPYLEKLVLSDHWDQRNAYEWEGNSNPLYDRGIKAKTTGGQRAPLRTTEEMLPSNILYEHGAAVGKKKGGVKRPDDPHHQGEPQRMVRLHQKERGVLKIDQGAPPGRKGGPAFLSLVPSTESPVPATERGVKYQSREGLRGGHRTGKHERAFREGREGTRQ